MATAIPLKRLKNRTLSDPHSFLGLHSTESGKIIRLWRPGASKIHIEVKGKMVDLQAVDHSGLFEYGVPRDFTPNDYRVYHQSGLLAHDPYTFWPTVGEVDTYLFSKGTHYELYRILGAHPMIHQGIEGVQFAVWAPSARSVSLVGDHNHWDGRTTPMRSLGSSGIWEIFIPGLKIGEKYKFEIVTATGQILLKTDPYGMAFELRPKTAAAVADYNRHSWNDQAWLLQRRKNAHKPQPMTVYEVHLGSWRWDLKDYYSIAHALANYCAEMGFTHVELMPAAEHPYDPSWGYQVTGFFAPTSRFGSLEDFQGFVDILHNKGIGVIVDWVPAHFPKDDFALANFDGTALYEHEDPKQGFHPHWHTLIFNYGRHEVSNFLIASALFWIEKLHVDGLRVDAVASMLYLDYGREEGEWIPNRYGGRENLEAIEFLRHLNSIVHERNPGVLMIAEESTSFMGVTHFNGLGFDFKWNMGWMNDTLRYFEKDPIYRTHHHNDLTFGLLYAFSEQFMLPFSHDEVVHGKRSLLSKMPGDTWQKFANLRLLYSYMIAQPGKKLLFMGGEIGQWDEWDHHRGIQWNLLQYPVHSGLHRCFKELNHLYLQHPALWEKDGSHHTFSWIDLEDRENSVISYLRIGHNEHLLCVHHFTPSYLGNYRIPLRNAKEIREIFNSDSLEFGGSGKTNPYPRVHHDHIEIQMPPLATMIFSIHF